MISINKFMIAFVFIFVALSPLVIAQETHYFHVFGTYHEGKVSLDWVEMEFSQFNYYAEKQYGDYFIYVIDSDEYRLNEINFTIPIFAIGEYVDENGIINDGEEIFFDTASFDVLVPYHALGKYLVVTDFLGIELDRILVSQFSRDGFNKDDFEGLYVGDYGVKGNDAVYEDREINEEVNYVIVLLIVLILLVAILVYTLKEKRR